MNSKTMLNFVLTVILIGAIAAAGFFGYQCYQMYNQYSSSIAKNKELQRQYDDLKTQENEIINKNVLKGYDSVYYLAQMPYSQIQSIILSVGGNAYSVYDVENLLDIDSSQYDYAEVSLVCENIADELNYILESDLIVHGLVVDYEQGTIVIQIE